MNTKKIVVFLCMVVMAMCLPFLVGHAIRDCVAAQIDDETVVISGLLFSKTERVGTKSEGPEYYLKPSDQDEIRIIKQCELWQEDPALHPYVDTEVTITGAFVGWEIYYLEVRPLQK